MKTTKLVALVTVIVFAIASLSATADGISSKSGNKYELSISLNQAAQMPGLVQALYQQVDPASLTPLEGGITYTVTYMGYTVHVTGTYYQWLLFFNIKKISIQGYVNNEVES